MEPIDAIVEGGLLRPLEPLSLPEQTKVRVTVDVPLPVQENGANGNPSEAHPGNADRLAALRASWAVVDADADTGPDDAWSARDGVDAYLYGKTEDRA